MKDRELEIFSERMQNQFNILFKKLDDVRTSFDSLYSTFMNGFDRLDTRLDAILTITKSLS